MIMIDADDVSKHADNMQADVIAKIIGRLGLEKTMFEASNQNAFEWFIKISKTGMEKVDSSLNLTTAEFGSMRLSFFIVHSLICFFFNPNNQLVHEQGDTWGWFSIVLPCCSLCIFQANWNTYLAELRSQAVAEDMNLHQVIVDHFHNIQAPLEQQIHDEL
ncbi:hypothetical protein RYX36_033444 [Vicia faba]